MTYVSIIPIRKIQHVVHMFSWENHDLHELQGKMKAEMLDKLNRVLGLTYA